VDLLTIHGRTVKEMYRSEVHYDAIAQAVGRVRCPVLANGNVTSSASAASVLARTRAAGVMIGRHAIRNPWIFRQCREYFAAASTVAKTGAAAPVGRVAPNPPPLVPSEFNRRVKDNAPYPSTVGSNAASSVFCPTLADVRDYID